MSATLKKEFGEEAMNSLEANPDEKKKIEKQINQLFSQGEKVKFYFIALFHTSKCTCPIVQVHAYICLSRLLHLRSLPSFA